MSDVISIGQAAPDIKVQHWVQGEPANFSSLGGHVVLVEVFQVNCPGCFLHALPEVIRLHTAYKDKGLVVIGLATAFEDFDKNTLDNLELLIKTGEMIGDPLQQLGKSGLLNKNKLDYSLPFAVGMDKLVENNEELTDSVIEDFICTQLPEYPQWPEQRKAEIFDKARNYLESKTHKALTFETYQLQGTPSSILVDQQGILRDISFGWANHLEPMIKDLLHNQIE